MVGLSDVTFDRHGHLAHRGDWTKALATAMAEQDGLTLTAEHWEVIEFVRSYYDRFQMAPPMRVLVKAMGKALGPQKGNSRHLYRLFPDSPARQACRYGGLPKPVGCI